jgi:hypothetical protein
MGSILSDRNSFTNGGIELKKRGFENPITKSLVVPTRKIMVPEFSPNAPCRRSLHKGNLLVILVLLTI